MTRTCLFFFHDTATTAIYTLSYTTLFRSGPHRSGLGPDRRAHLGRGLSGAEEDAEETPARLFQGELLLRLRGVRRQAGDRMRPRLLSERPHRVRLGLPVRSGEGHVLHPRDAEDSRQP